MSDPSIFKAYDIRGIYPDQLNEETAYSVGRAFATFIPTPEVIVGRDMRLSGPPLVKNLIRGLTDQGTNVNDVGMVSTDQYYFICTQTGLPGIMVTASHNPKQYNGFKMVKKMPYLLSGDEGIQDIKRLVIQNEFSEPKTKGVVKRDDFSRQFIEKVLSLVDKSSIKPLTVVADTANGMVGPILKQIYSQIPIKFIGLYLEPDGNLPNHGLDPLQPENRAELARRVVQEKADVGFAFDGDGDRFFVIDDRGEFIAGDYLTALLGQYFLEKSPGSKVLYDIRASWAVRDLITAAGGEAVYERVGHAFIKKRMATDNIIFGGEVTGHYYFRDFNYADSGVIPSLLILEMLSKKGVKLSSLVKPLEEKYFISGEINYQVSDAKAKISQLKAKYADGEQNELDGITVTYPDWHFNVRASNTEPLLRLNLEANTKELMEQKRDEVQTLIQAR